MRKWKWNIKSIGKQYLHGESKRASLGCAKKNNNSNLKVKR